MAQARPPLPFGLGSSPSCGSRCLQPGVPLPLGTPLADQVAHALSALFSTFYATSLRYLGVSEILDWIEANRTIEAWLCTGIEQGRSALDVASDKNLEVGRSAIKQVIKAALDQDDEAWATSLREVGFSSGLSMAFEGIVSQLKHNKSSPLPCLHTLITPSGLAMLKSAPLKHAFPICPPRTPPSPQALLTSIRSLLASGALTGPEWKQASVWRPQIRRAFAAYHALVKEVAEEVVCDAAFSTEYQIFLDSISQPIQLLQLISDDFEAEFGPGACKGLLGVGEVGGQNLIQIMDFCAAKRPSELLARVKTRVAEKQLREKIKAAFDRKKELIANIREQETILMQRLLDLQNAKAEHTPEFGAVVARCTALVKERGQLEREVQEEETKEAEAEAAKVREKEARTAALGAAKAEKEREDEEMFKQGSSKDLLAAPLPCTDPFSANAPRAVSPSPQSAKGKGRAHIPNNGAGRSPARYGPIRNALPPRSLSPSLSRPSSRSSSPAPSNYSAPPPDYTPPPSPPRRSTKLPRSHLNPSTSPSRSPARRPPTEAPPAQCTDDACCTACAGEMLQSTMAPILAQRSISAGTREASSDRGGGIDGGERPTKKKGKKKKKAKSALRDGGVGGAGASQALSVDESGMMYGFDQQDHESAYVAHRGAKGWIPRSVGRAPAPTCCPPDRCTGDRANHAIWPQLDGLLYETCAAAFKYELIGNLADPLILIRDKLAKSYLSMGGLMTVEGGEPKDMTGFVRLAEKGMWSAVTQLEVQDFTQRTLAVALMKLMEVFTAQLGPVCICRLSNHPEVLANTHHRLSQRELADRKIPIDLPAMDQQAFMKWAHVKLRENAIGGPEWTGVDRSYRLADFLLSFADAFDGAIDRMIARDPYILAEDLLALLEWQGGVRIFDEAMRLCGGSGGRGSLETQVGGMRELGTVEERSKRALAHWGRLLDLATVARASGEEWNNELAEREKRNGNAHFGDHTPDAYLHSINAFATASLIDPENPVYWANAAAARIKIGGVVQYREAISDCSMALALDPMCVKALYRRGTALAMMGRWADSVKDLTALVKLCPDDQLSKNALETAIKKATMSGGGRVTKEATKTKPPVM
ncbi:hypothetical protein BCR35DRAFT_308491 [Leucosporidium creatinivorum]|uniref:Uncharacterized protein n=1 Tax=Leucosporidium creatinivorum TaxID=106004 RepID=A0A1Y2E6Z4_9BASI|nr:hypothetical protein BCR35DRAFT_308491 [Leucosporidium creatinivorum]